MSKVTYVCRMQTHLQRALPCLILQHILVVRRVHLLQEDECQNGVRSQTGIVRGKSLPQAKEPFLTDHLYQHILSKNNTKTRCSLTAIKTVVIKIGSKNCVFPSAVMKMKLFITE